MSITGALSNALTGLTASSRAVEVVSSNLANAMTEGYGRRSLSLSPRTIGAAGGVNVVGITRHSDPELVGERRLAQSGQKAAERLFGFHQTLENAIGLPDDGGSLTARLVAFETSLTVAASRPDIQSRLQSVVDRASEFTAKLRMVSDTIQNARMGADRTIASMVDQLNTYLGQVRDLNQQISAAVNHGKETASLHDLRQTVIDKVAELVPLRQVPRDRESVALISTGGVILLDGSASEVSFTASNVIVPHMTIEDGLLSGLTVNGTGIRTDSENGPLRGGALGALFQIRDEAAVTAQTQLDAFSRDLIARLQDSGVDPTLTGTDAGFLTDGGSRFDPVDEIGLSARLSVNALVDPAEGGDLARLRDGLGATATTAEIGDAARILALSGALSALSTPLSGSFGAAARTSADLAAQLLGQASEARVAREHNLSFATARATELMQLELEDGVDSDHELQRLLVIEQTYAANAKVIQTVDSLIEELLRL